MNKEVNIDKKVGMKLTAMTMVNDLYAHTKQKEKTGEEFVKDCTLVYDWLMEGVDEEKGAAGVTQLRPVLN